jgi:predicted TIM-barrel fold metal-dependent hydrolase
VAPIAGGVDTHAHVWTRPLIFIPEARHRPDYDAPVESYLAHLDAHGLAKGLLIQPSFLGANNSLMLDAVRRHRDRLNAVVVIDAATPLEKLVELEGQGAVGVRFNLVGLPLPDFAAEPYRGFLAKLAGRNWHVEIHREACDLPKLIPALLDAGVKVAIDHFGRPDPAAPASDPGFRYLLTTGASKRVWVKVSAAYRSGGKRTAFALVPLLLEHFDPERLLWGSDWPHTQHESAVNYGSTFSLFEESIPDVAVRRRILENAPAEL